MRHDKETPFEPGTSIGFYIVDVCLGTGGFGAVYRARRGAKTYALKVGFERFGDMSEAKRHENGERFSREVAALNSVRHPNVVGVHGYDRFPDEDGYPYLVMDYVDGQRFLDWRSKSRPSLRLICQVVAKVSLALDAMHAAQVFHRDLKSENVLVRRDGEPVVVDFGIARPSGSPTVTEQGFFVGTPKFLPPELIKHLLSPAGARGEPFPQAPTADLYSVGLMLYIALSGHLPVPGKKKEEIFAAIQCATPEAPDALNQRVPAGLSTLVMKLLSKDPAARPQSGAELANALGELLDSVPVPTPAWDDRFLLPAEADAMKAAPESAPDEGDSTPHHAEPERPAVRAAAEPRPVDALSLTSRATKGDRPQPKEEKRAATGGNGRLPVAAAHDADAQFRAPSVSKAAPLSSELRSVRARQGRPGENEDGESPASQLRRAIPDTAGERRSRFPLIAGAVVLLAVVSVLALAASDKRAVPTGPKNLIKQVEEQEKQLRALSTQPSVEPVREDALATPRRVPPVADVNLAADVGVAPSATPTRTVALPNAPPGAPYAREPSGMTADGRRLLLPRRSPVGSGAGNPDAAAIDEDFSREYGSVERPVIPGPRPGTGPGQVPSVNAPMVDGGQRTSGPAWLHVAERVDGPVSVTSGFGIPLGAHIRARLKTNLDSRTAQDGFVEARLERPFMLNGEVRLPSRTMLYGRATAASGRFNVHFMRMVLPSGRDVALDGLAYDVEERKAGLRASRTTLSTGQRPDGKVTRVAKGAAQVLVGAIAQGDVASEAAQRAAQETLTNDSNQGGASDSAAFLDAGLDFDIFLVSAL